MKVGCGLVGEVPGKSLSGTWSFASPGPWVMSFSSAASRLWAAGVMIWNLLPWSGASPPCLISGKRKRQTFLSWLPRATWLISSFLEVTIVPFYEHFHPAVAELIIPFLWLSPMVWLLIYCLSVEWVGVPTDPTDEVFRSLKLPLDTDGTLWDWACSAGGFLFSIMLHPFSVCASLSRAAAVPSKSLPHPISWTLYGTGEAPLLTGIRCISWK